MEGLHGVERTLLLYVSLLFENKDEFIRKFYSTINIRGFMGNCSDFNPVCAIGPIRLIVLKRWTTALNVRGEIEKTSWRVNKPSSSKQSGCDLKAQMGKTARRESKVLLLLAASASCLSACGIPNMCFSGNVELSFKTHVFSSITFSSLPPSRFRFCVTEAAAGAGTPDGNAQGGCSNVCWGRFMQQKLKSYTSDEVPLMTIANCA